MPNPHYRHLTQTFAMSLLMIAVQAAQISYIEDQGILDRIRDEPMTGNVEAIPQLKIKSALGVTRSTFVCSNTYEQPAVWPIEVAVKMFVKDEMIGTIMHKTLKMGPNSQVNHFHNQSDTHKVKIHCSEFPQSMKLKPFGYWYEIWVYSPATNGLKRVFVTEYSKLKLGHSSAVWILQTPDMGWNAPPKARDGTRPTHSVSHHLDDGNPSEVVSPTSSIGDESSSHQSNDDNSSKVVSPTSNIGNAREGKSNKIRNTLLAMLPVGAAVIGETMRRVYRGGSFGNKPVFAPSEALMAQSDVIDVCGADDNTIRYVLCVIGGLVLLIGIGFGIYIEWRKMEVKKAQRRNAIGV